MAILSHCKHIPWSLQSHTCKQAACVIQHCRMMHMGRIRKYMQALHTFLFKLLQSGILILPGEPLAKSYWHATSWIPSTWGVNTVTVKITLKLLMVLHWWQFLLTSIETCFSVQMVNDIKQLWTWPSQAIQQIFHHATRLLLPAPSANFNISL